MESRKVASFIKGMSFEVISYLNVFKIFKQFNVVDANIIRFLKNIVNSIENVADAPTFLSSPDECRIIETKYAHNCYMKADCKFCKTGNIVPGMIFPHLCFAKHSQKHVKNSERNYMENRLKEAFTSFMVAEQQIFLQNSLNPNFLDRYLDFYTISRSFFKSLRKYEIERKQLPEMSVMRWLFVLLNEINSFMDNNPFCIKSIPYYENILYKKDFISICYEFNGRILNSATDLKSHLILLDQNSITTSPNINIMRGVPLRHQQYKPYPTIHIPLLPPNPNIQPFIHPPPINIFNPLVPNGFTAIPGPLNPPMHNTATGARQTNPPVSNMFPSAATATGQPLITNSPKNNKKKESPETETTETKNELKLPDELKEFLRNPKVDDLLETGNILMNFHEYSIIPNELEKHLKLNFAELNCKIKPFGAMVSGVGYEDDVINLFVDCGEANKTKAHVMSILNDLFEFFNSNQKVWAIEEKSINGLKSHISVQNKIELITSRISFASELYASNTELIQYFMYLQPMCQELCYLIQEWANHLKLNLSRYIIIVLAIFYFQTKQLLPSIKTLHEGVDIERFVDHWQSNFVRKELEELSLRSCEMDLKKSALDFFYYYGKAFSFEDCVVCPYLGHKVVKSFFDDIEHSNAPIKRYRQFARSEFSKGQLFANKTEMCIQDLLELNNNITSHLKNDCDTFVKYCQITHDFLTNQ